MAISIDTATRKRRACQRISTSTQVRQPAFLITEADPSWRSLYQEELEPGIAIDVLPKVDNLLGRGGQLGRVSYRAVLLGLNCFPGAKEFNSFVQTLKFDHEELPVYAIANSSTGLHGEIQGVTKQVRVIELVKKLNLK